MMKKIYTKHIGEFSHQLAQPKFRWVLWIFGALASMLLLITLLNAMNAKKSQAAWYDDTYAYRQKITFGNTGAAVVNQKVKLDVDTATIITNNQMRSDCDDTRFTDLNGLPLSYFLDS